MQKSLSSAYRQLFPARVYWFVAWLMTTAYFTASAQTALTKHLQQELNRTNQPARQARLLYQLSQQYESVNIDSARYYGDKSLILAQHLRDQRLQTLVYTQMGHLYDQLSKPTEALTFFNKALQLVQQFPADTVTALVQASMATFFLRQGDQEKALKAGLEALRQYEQAKQPMSPSLSYLYNILGNVYSNINNVPLALAYYNRQQQLAEHLHDPLSMGRASGNKGDLYLRIGDLNKAEAETRQSLAFLQPLQHKYFVSVALSNLGSIYFQRHQYEQAIDFHRQSLSVRQKLGVPIYIARSYLHLAECYYALNDYPLALSYCTQAIELFRKANNQRAHLQKSMEIKARVLAKTNKHQQAFAYLEEAMALKDSLSGIEKTKAVAQVQASFDLERKQNQITLLNKNLAIQHLQADQRQKQLTTLHQDKRLADLNNQLLSKQQLLNLNQIKLQTLTTKRQQGLITHQQAELLFASQRQLLYLAILSMLIGLVVVISYFLRRQHSARQQLSYQKEALEQQAQQLAELNNTKDKLFSLISHDLRSPVVYLKQGFLSLQKQVVAQPALTKQISVLDAQLDQLLDLLTNLLTWAHNQLMGDQIRPQAVDLAEITHLEVAQLAMISHQKEITIINHVDPQLRVLADASQLRAVIRNLLSNAIKFTTPGGYIRLSTTHTDTAIVFQISDTGVGMSADQVGNLFREPQVRRGTLGEKGIGLGLRLSRELLQKQSARLTVKSEENKGTDIRIHLKRYE